MHTMHDILVCTHNPILLKSLYGVLRDEGFDVAISDHPALAVQMVLKKDYAAVLIDAQTFGLPVDDSIQIIKSISPEATVIVIGSSEYDSDALSVRIPVDLAEVKKLVHNMNTVSKI